MGSKVRGRKPGEKKAADADMARALLLRKQRQMKAAFLVVLLVMSGSMAFIIRHYRDGGDPDDDGVNDYHRAIELGGEWFLNNQDNSFLHYEYDIMTRRHSTAHHSLREMGALWSIALLSGFLDDERYENLTHRGFLHFEKTFVYDQHDDFFFVNITPAKIKLGYSAFVILTLLEMEHELKDYYLEQFAKGILYQQNDDGSFRTFFYSSEDTGVEYYPGQSMFALMRLYGHTRNRTYLDAVEKAFPYYREYFRSTNSTAIIPWQTRAVYHLYQETRKREYADFLFEMSDYLTRAYFPAEDCSGFTFQSNTVAVHMEGITQAYSLARELRERDRQTCYGNFIREGADFIMGLQVTDTANIFAMEAVGGFREHRDSQLQRVDWNQHAVVSLMDGYQLGILA